VSEVEAHSIEEISGYFKGTCKECLKREKGLEGHKKKRVSCNEARRGGSEWLIACRSTSVKFVAI
jgi:hypothetical protein